MLDRREFLKGAFYQTAASGLYLSKNNQGLPEVQLVKHKINYPDLPKEFNQYKIAFVSDFHHGPFLRPEWLEAAINYLKKEEYDLLLLGGDYLASASSPLKRNIYPWHNQDFKKEFTDEKIKSLVYKQLADLLKSLKVSDGIYSIYGNHDRWEAQQTCQSVFKKNNLNLLVNSQAEITRGQKKIVIHGIDDYWTGFPRLKKSAIKQNNFNILLAHNPDYIAEDSIRRGIPFNLALCGHTHGGQICLPIIGGIYYNIQQLKYASGLVKEKTNQYVLTSNGLGTVELPYRFNCPPEVCIIELSNNNY